jgi:tRNA-splicing ligase RtcB (3'-phosphate/5'-hydroxy nucleic acid ligase)
MNKADPKITTWSPEPLTPEVRQSLQRLSKSEDVVRVSVMPDVHIAGDVCNGVAMATEELIYPQAIGADIGCGMLAVAIDLPATALSDQRPAARVLTEITWRIPSLKHDGTQPLPELTETLIQNPLSARSLDKLKHRDGRWQLGTLGRGNHFVELQSDTHGRLWLMIHSGSRGMGQLITDHHLHVTKLSDAGFQFFDASSAEGESYLSDLNWAIAYANENRLAMATSIDVLMLEVFKVGLDWSTLIHCHHNHVQRELFGDQEYWVHRKGALLAADMLPGVIPGSMGQHSYHVTGRGVDAALRSSSHGAGRKLPRVVAHKQISRRDLQQQMEGIWFDHRRENQLLDEAPAAYKDIGRVMRAQRELTRITRELTPVLVYKGY